jgi:hypothetical protein
MQVRMSIGCVCSEHGRASEKVDGIVSGFVEAERVSLDGVDIVVSPIFFRKEFCLGESRTKVLRWEVAEYILLLRDVKEFIVC